MRVLLVAATNLEIESSIRFMKVNFTLSDKNVYTNNKVSISVLITGVGMVSTTFHLSNHLASVKYDLIVNAGIAGAFDHSLKLGEVVQVYQEQLAGFGAEMSDGSMLTVFDMGLLSPNEPPFKDQRLINLTEIKNLKSVSGLTVQKVHGSISSIKQAKLLYDSGIESMEGAAFFYCCLMTKVPFLQIRSISNYVEPRNRDNWKIPLAIQQLNDFLITCLQDGFNLKDHGADS